MVHFDHFMGEPPEDIRRYYYDCAHAGLMGLLSGPVPLGWMLNHNLKILNRPTAARWGYFSGIAYMFLAVCALAMSFYLATVLIFLGGFVVLYWQLGETAGELERDADMAPFPTFYPLHFLQLSWITSLCTGVAAMSAVFFLATYVLPDLPFLEDVRFYK